MSIHIAALYIFVPLDEPTEVKAWLEAEAARAGIKGTLLVAREGLNGTIAAGENALQSFLAVLRSDARFAHLDVKYSVADEEPFRRMKVRLKREIVTMGVEGIDPRTHAGTYVEAADWNALITREDTVVIDTRNDYEVAIGTFEGAVDPKTHAFRDFPAWVAENKALFEGKKNIAMFCTGGIRCEKSTAYMKTLGYENVFHLKGGILKYLEEVDTSQSRWHGDCFVFDERVSVGHGLAPGHRTLCRACRHPLFEGDMEAPGYEEGVSCPRCVDATTDAQKASYRERQRQMDLAADRGVAHMGPDAEG